MVAEVVGVGFWVKAGVYIGCVAQGKLTSGDGTAHGHCSYLFRPASPDEIAAVTSGTHIFSTNQTSSYELRLRRTTDFDESDKLVWAATAAYDWHYSQLEQAWNSRFPLAEIYQLVNPESYVISFSKNAFSGSKYPITQFL